MVDSILDCVSPVLNTRQSLCRTDEQSGTRQLLRTPSVHVTPRPPALPEPASFGEDVDGAENDVVMKSGGSSTTSLTPNPRCQLEKNQNEIEALFEASVGNSRDQRDLGHVVEGGPSDRSSVISSLNKISPL